MKYILKSFLLLMAVGVFSCSDDFLESESTELISTDRMAEVGPLNAEIFNGTIRGLYTLMYQTGTGGTDLDHNDFGQKGYDIFSDMLSGDMVLGGYNYGWYKNLANLTTTLDYRDNDNYKPWRYYYRIIRATNTIIDGLGGNDAVLESDDAKWQMGQAKTMRAYCYFYLANLYAEEYNPATPILPLTTSLTEVDMPLSTGADVWARIKSDLEASSTLLDGYTREGLQGVDQDVANGLLAYTYLTMGEYGNAATTAQKLIDKYAIIPRDLAVYNGDNKRNAFSYIDGDGADWIWGMDLTLDQGLDLVSWWGQVDIFTYSYAWAGDPKTMDAGLFASIPDTDVRKGQFIDPWSESLNYPAYKFYAEGLSIGGQREVTSDYVYMRVEEMVLIKAEAEAFDNKDVDAQTTLLQLVSERDTDYAFISGLTGQALKDEIYHQWRIEMWGEGKSYLAMKRNKATIVREGHIEYNEAIPYNDDRLTLDIPYQEIQDNPNIN
ncbi:hypothetical protein BZG02_01125 [Labilibaculum filiforme]|uniref:RagB/SusD family nutrient uptake outer membrane protein n=1 Tax=Labilibaculum filiforme TaxID=1940526 RepID=A0A2N3I5R0_9BACT|nr:RagB/SusD family nutrient uptake outer membrane protein [Labilibaculum filiforme]PKQ65636.1 hypothetical protein BZG02_01125 [Labilibaculum filiforme]